MIPRLRFIVALITLAIGLTACTVGCSKPSFLNLDVALNPNPKVPLAAVADVTLNEPCRIDLRIEVGGENWTVSASSQYKTEHSVPVLGLRPGRTNTITVIAIDKDGERSESRSTRIEVAPLPDDFPILDLRVSQPDRM